MTLYDVQVLAMALGIGLGSIAYVHRLGWKLDRDLGGDAREREERRRARSKPAQ